MDKILLLLSVTILTACKAEIKNNKTKFIQKVDMEKDEIITLGGGCYWCTEAIFQRLNGVDSLVTGFMGGITVNPTYEEVCTGKTGHAEVSQITFNPEVISLKEILEVFFTTHDPTTLDRQGEDIGNQYRSVVFYKDEKQKATAEQVIQEIEKEQIYDSPIVTTLEPAGPFYQSPDYHKNYYNQHGEKPYCSFVIAPKVKKFKEKYQDKLK